MKITRRQLRKLIAESINESSKEFKGRYRAHPSQFRGYDDSSDAGYEAYRDYTLTGDESLKRAPGARASTAQPSIQRLPEEEIQIPTDFSSLPVIDYNEAKNDSDGRYSPAGPLPQGRAANGNKDFFFMTHLSSGEAYPSVYTKYRPTSEKAERYAAAGIRGVWYDGRYNIGSYAASSIAGLNRSIDNIMRMPDINNPRGR